MHVPYPLPFRLSQRALVGVITWQAVCRRKISHWQLSWLRPAGLGKEHKASNLETRRDVSLATRHRGTPPHFFSGSLVWP